MNMYLHRPHSQLFNASERSLAFRLATTNDGGRCGELVRLALVITESAMIELSSLGTRLETGLVCGSLTVYGCERCFLVSLALLIPLSLSVYRLRLIPLPLFRPLLSFRLRLLALWLPLSLTAPVCCSASIPLMLPLTLLLWLLWFDLRLTQR